MASGVKISNSKDTKVFAGSALTAVNTQSVILYNYTDTISLTQFQEIVKKCMNFHQTNVRNARNSS